MTIETLEHELQRSIAEKVRLVTEGAGRYRVSTPFVLEDGDHLVIVLKNEGARWMLSDEGHTGMHLADHMDARDDQRGTRRTLVAKALERFRIEDRDGELLLDMPDGRLGETLCTFLHGLLAISAIAYLDRFQDLADPGTDDGSGAKR